MTNKTNEFGFLGADCGRIKTFCSSLTQGFPGGSVGYLDANHGDDVPDLNGFGVLATTYASGFDFQASEGSYPEALAKVREKKLVFINGNHFDSPRQVVFIQASKKESLQRKLKRLHEVVLVVLVDCDKPFDYLLPKLEGVPIIRFEEAEKAADIISGLIPRPKPLGLILAGGESRRMGHPKKDLTYGKANETAVDRIKGLLQDSGLDFLVSVNPKQFTGAESELQDEFIDFGPMGGILTALKKTDNRPILTIPVDMPNISKSSVVKLLKSTNAFEDGSVAVDSAGRMHAGFAVWSPSTYSSLLNRVAVGDYSLTAAIESMNFEYVKFEDSKLININTPEAYEAYE